MQSYVTHNLKENKPLDELNEAISLTARNGETKYNCLELKDVPKTVRQALIVSLALFLTE